VSRRPERLERLLAIRRLSADLDRRALQMTLASVGEVEAAIKAQVSALAQARRAGRDALVQGNRCEWWMAEAQEEMAGWNRGRLEALLRARLAEVAPATKKFLESRREHEQVKQLVEDAKQAAALDEDRRAQGAADDCFLGKRARAKWNE
jgi:hypothetical protein